MKLLITGGAGFIGSNFIRYILKRADVEVVNFDCLTYAGNLENLASIEKHQAYTFVKGDITNPAAVGACLDSGVEAIINFAAESHVDRSILDSSAFIRTNVQGTQVLLEAARRRKIGRFIQISTDEVYGTLGATGRFTEESPLAPNSPYAASKAGADLLARSYGKTFAMPVIITRCSNNYGPYQFPEKLIPLMILNALEDQALPVYGDGLHTRDWIHVEDHCRALEAVLFKGSPGRVYNIGGDQERRNLDVVHRILEQLGKTADLIRFVNDRPGHDRRYAINATRIHEELGWTPATSFEDGLNATVRWYMENPDWVRSVRSGEYQAYYQKMYDRRDETLLNL
jgi:dTDP-glucose 4,6-dehydratase